MSRPIPNTPPRLPGGGAPIPGIPQMQPPVPIMRVSFELTATPGLPLPLGTGVRNVQYETTADLQANPDVLFDLLFRAMQMALHEAVGDRIRQLKEANGSPILRATANDAMLKAQ
jgi:hypothetical protein